MIHPQHTSAKQLSLKNRKYFQTASKINKIFTVPLKQLIPPKQNVLKSLPVSNIKRLKIQNIKEPDNFNLSIFSKSLISKMKRPTKKLKKKSNILLSNVKFYQSKTLYQSRQKNRQTFFQLTNNNILNSPKIQLKKCKRPKGNLYPSQLSKDRYSQLISE